MLYSYSTVFPVSLSFGFSRADRRFPIFRTALIPSGVSPNRLRRRCFPSSPPSLSSMPLRRVSCIDRRVYMSSFYAFRLPYAAAGGEYYTNVTIISNATVFLDIPCDAMLIFLINSDLLLNYSQVNLQFILESVIKHSSWHSMVVDYFPCQFLRLPISDILASSCNLIYLLAIICLLTTNHVCDRFERGRPNFHVDLHTRSRIILPR